MTSNPTNPTHASASEDFLVPDAWELCEEYIPELDGVYEGDPTDTERNAMWNSMRD